MELLVALSILAILAALLLPVFDAGRRKAQETACITNLQQLSHALAMYTTDYDGTYPLMFTGTVVNQHATEESKQWEELLQVYLHTDTFPACPLRQWQETLPGRAKTMGCFSGYAWNIQLNRSVRSKASYSQEGRKEASFANPACTVTLLESRVGIDELRCPDIIRSRSELDANAGYRLIDLQIEALLKQTPGALRHHGGANYAFADGHINWFKPEQLRTDKKSDGVHPGFGF